MEIKARFRQVLVTIHRLTAAACISLPLSLTLHQFNLISRPLLDSVSIFPVLPLISHKPKINLLTLTDNFLFIILL